MYKLNTSVKLSKLILLLLFSFTSMSASGDSKINVVNLKVAGDRKVVSNYPAFNSFDIVVGSFDDTESKQLFLWETLPQNFNCHFHSLEPFFNFNGKKYWVDSSLPNPLNAGEDAFEVFLDNYFEQIAFKGINKDLYYVNKNFKHPELENQIPLLELGLQENDIIVFLDKDAVKVHSGRFVKYSNGNAVVTSKMGGGPIEVMSLKELVEFYSYADLYQIRIFRRTSL